MRKNVDTTLTITADYRQFIEELKQRVVSARISAARRVNHELILLYWDIGRGIVEKQQVLGWGDSVVEQVAGDLRRAFPEMRGWSLANVWRMRQLYLVYCSEEFLAQVAREMAKKPPTKGLRAILEQPVPEICSAQVAGVEQPILARLARELVAAVPWGHHILLLGKIKSPSELCYYLRATAQFGWSRNVLLNLLNDKERGADDQPSIGIILCAEKDDVDVEYALRSKTNPIGVAAYELQSRLPGALKGKLPSAKQLADIVRGEMEAGTL